MHKRTAICKRPVVELEWLKNSNSSLPRTGCMNACNMYDVSTIHTMYVYRRPIFKCEDAINVNASFFPDSQLLETQLKYTYIVRGDESRRAQNAIIEFTISLKSRKQYYYAFKCGPTV